MYRERKRPLCNEAAGWGKWLYAFALSLTLAAFAGCRAFEFSSNALPVAENQISVLAGSLVQATSDQAVPLTTPMTSSLTAHESNLDLENPVSLPEVEPSPLKFVFPDQAPAPVSDWRPPLYEVPWAPTPYDHFLFTRPIAADEVNWPLENYRYGGVFFKNQVHTGIDIDAPKRTPILAAGPGKVIWAGFGLLSLSENPKDPYGLAVAIRHDFGYEDMPLYTVYGHMDETFVRRGQHVETGDVLGLVGETGKVTGPHLHFEVRIGRGNYGQSRNPELWIAPPYGWGILVARVMDTNGSYLEKHLVKIFSLDKNRWWEVRTYGSTSHAITIDPYYKENMVIGDLPAGRYMVWIKFGDTTYDQEVQIFPGRVSFFTFRGKQGFDLSLPAAPASGFIPPVE